MITITCPRCGTENSNEAMNCKQCQINLKYALEHPEEIKTLKQRDQESIQESITKSQPTTSPNANKARDFAVGFFGWLVIWNSLGLAVFAFYDFCSILEFIGLVLLFVLGKKWIGFGAVSYVIANTILISVLRGEFTLYGLTVPFTTLFFSY